MPKKKVVNKKKKLEDYEQKYICDVCKNQIILGKNVKIKNEELTCRHKLKDNLTLFFD